MSDDLRTWLAETIEQRRWSHRELARQSGLSHSLVSKTLSGEMKASPEFCIKVAEALELSPVLVLVKAGILPPQQPADDSIIQELVELARNLPREDRQELLDYARFRYQKRKG